MERTLLRVLVPIAGVILVNIGLVFFDAPWYVVPSDLLEAAYATLPEKGARMGRGVAASIEWHWSHFEPMERIGLKLLAAVKRSFTGLGHGLRVPFAVVYAYWHELYLYLSTTRTDYEMAFMWLCVGLLVAVILYLIPKQWFPRSCRKIAHEITDSLVSEPEETRTTAARLPLPPPPPIGKPPTGKKR